jgi:hypothetical protein
LDHFYAEGSLRGVRTGVKMIGTRRFKKAV